jgi:CubicO group peptidase (beta-lactamase class C family)
VFLEGEQVACWLRTREGAQPFWEPGSAHGYHAITYGWLVGEVIRRAGGRTVGQMLREDVSGRFDIDFHVGLTHEEEARVTDVRPSPPSTGVRNLIAEIVANPQGMTALAFTNPALVLLPEFANSHAWRTAELAAVNGHTNARALARVYGVLASGGSQGGRQLLSAAMIAQASREESAGKDLVLGEPTRFGLGFMLSTPAGMFGGPGCFGHPGAGGAVGFADPDRRLGFGYTPNRLGTSILVDPRAAELIRAAYDDL